MRRFALQGAVVIIAIIVTFHIDQTFGSDEYLSPGPGPPTPEDVERPLVWNTNTIVGLAAAALACALSMSAGVGGGGILVPIFNLILGFGIKQSTGLSQSVIASSGIGSAVYAFTHGRPDSPREPLVDMHLALLLTPALLVGVSLGLIANQVSPGWLLSTAIIVVLSYMSVRTLKSAQRLRQAEKNLLSTDDILMCEDTFVGEVAFIPSPALEQLEPPEQQQQQLQQQQQSIQIPWLKLGQLVLLWLTFGGLQIGKSRVEHCSWGYGGLYMAQVIITLACTIWILKEDTSTSPEGRPQEGGERDDNEEPLLQECIEDDGLLRAVVENKEIGAADRKMGLVALLAAGAGVIAGLIGLGGGFLLAPLMIELGVPPQVAAATSALMVLFASSSATLSLIAEARLNLAYASTFGGVCCASGFIGGFLLSKVVRRHGSSVVVFLLAGIIAIGAGATIVFNGRTVLVQLIDGHLAGFHSFCQQSSGPLANPLSVLGIM